MALAGSPNLARIPAGEFLMGAADGAEDERPVRRVPVDAFYVGRFPVTPDQYARFVRATGYPAPAVRTLPLAAPAGRDRLFRDLRAPSVWDAQDPPAGQR